MTATALEQFEARGRSRRSRCAFLRYGNLRYENQEHGVEVLLPDGAIDAAAVAAIADAFHDAYEREYTYRLDAPVEFVGAHLVAIAEVGKLEPAPLPVTGRPLDDALKGRRERRLRDRGRPRGRRSTTASCSSPGMRFDGPGDRRDEGQHDRRPPRQRGRRSTTTATS